VVDHFKVLIFICAICGNLFSQNRTVDSLKLILSSIESKPDQNLKQCDVLMQLAEIADEGQWQNFNEQLIGICTTQIGAHPDKEKKYLKFLASGYNNRGADAIQKGKLKEAIANFSISVLYFKEIHDNKGLANSIQNLASTYLEMGDKPNAIKYYEEGKQIAELEGDTATIMGCLNYKASILRELGNFGKALDDLAHCLRLAEQTGNIQFRTFALNNMAQIYEIQKDTAASNKYFLEAYNLQMEKGDRYGQAIALINMSTVAQNRSDHRTALKYMLNALKLLDLNTQKQIYVAAINNIGQVYRKMDRSDSALYYLLKAVDLLKGDEGRPFTSSIMNNISMNYIRKNEYAKAQTYALEALKIAQEYRVVEDQMNASYSLYMVSKSKFDHKNALQHYESFIKLKDSLNNENNRKAGIRSQLKYEYEKQAAADSVAHAKETDIKNAELAKQKAEIRAKKNQQYALFGGLFGVCVFGVFMYNRFKVTQKQKMVIELQKEIVEEQKKLVEEKQKEILDSIHYARRIQMAQIPSEKRVAKLLENRK